MRRNRRDFKIASSADACILMSILFKRALLCVAAWCTRKYGNWGADERTNQPHEDDGSFRVMCLASVPSSGTLSEQSLKFKIDSGRNLGENEWREWPHADVIMMGGKGDRDNK